jgi:retinol dehydrogenase-12
MIFDLADLRTIKPAVEGFLSETQRLDVLFNNAAVMNPPKDSVTKQVSVLMPFEDPWHG